MKDATNVKEKIIEVTTELMEQSHGNTKIITARVIAEKAGVGLGLINYHFGSKENLIAICVQRIINNVLFNFSPDKKDYNEPDGFSDKERLTDWAIQIFDFLFENSAIANISILNDLQNYQAESNSVYTQKGFSLAIRKDIDEKDKRLIAFVLSSAMQAAFLTGKSSKEILGYDFNLKEERDCFIKKTVALLFGGIN